MTPDERRYYATQSRVSDPEDRGTLLAALPAEPAGLVPAISRLVPHTLFVRPLRITAPAGSEADVESRSVPRILDRILERDPAPLQVTRPPERRFIGICRDYTLLACAALRHHGVPARARVGFANYFTPGFNEDHWVCEYHAGGRWRLLDPELNTRVRDYFKVTFPPADVPRDAFLVAGEAWRRARADALDPATCGVSVAGIGGAWFIGGSVVRDLAALNKREMLAWDYWGLAREFRPGATVSDAAAVRLDTLAALTAGRDPDWRAIRETYDGDAELRVPGVVVSKGRREVAVDV